MWMKLPKESVVLEKTDPGWSMEGFLMFNNCIEEGGESFVKEMKEVINSVEFC